MSFSNKQNYVDICSDNIIVLRRIKNVEIDYRLLEKSCKYGCSWDFIFTPDSTDKTLASYLGEERFKYQNVDDYTKLVNFLRQNQTFMIYLLRR